MPRMNRRQFLAAPASLTAAGQPERPERNLLSGPYSLEKLPALLVPRGAWTPFPRAADRAAWLALAAPVRESVVSNGVAELKGDWPFLPAAWFLDYVRTGNREKADTVRSRRRNKLRGLVMAECAEYKGRFLDAIVDGTWATSEESYWGSPAHLNAQRAGAGLPDVSEPTVDLFAADTAALLAWTDYLLAAELERVSPLVRKRIFLEVDRRVLNPCEQRNDFWWMGLGPGGPTRSLNNWTPWVNSNWLTANLLLEPDEDRRRRMTHKSLRSLDQFLEGYHDDGGCDEGPSYWGRAGGSLFDCLELLHSASRGAIDVYGHPLVGEIGRYIVRAHIHDLYYVNFADASAKVRIDGDLVYRYGRRIGDVNMQMLGAWAAGAPEGSAARAGDIGRQLAALFNFEALRSSAAKQPLLGDVWLPGIQVMAARLREGSPEGFYVAAQGGHNAESHNHNDVGNFIVYADGEPAVIDIGVETYTARTFSSQRYEIWTMQSGWHNLPTVSGVMQAAGREFAAREVSYRSTGRLVEFTLDIAKAYPAQAGIRSWRRTIELDRDRNEVRVREQFDLSKRPSSITLTLVTPRSVEAPRPGRLTLAGTGFRSRVAVEFAPELLEAKTEEVQVKDARLRQSWGERLYRVLLTARDQRAQGDWMLRLTQPAQPE